MSDDVMEAVFVFLVISVGHVTEQMIGLLSCCNALLALNRLPADENFAIIGHWTSIPATHIL